MLFLSLCDINWHEDIRFNHEKCIRNQQDLSNERTYTTHTQKKRMISHPFFSLDQSSFFFLFTDKEWRKTLGRVNGARWWWWWWWSEYPEALELLALLQYTRRVQCSMTFYPADMQMKAFSVLDQSVEIQRRSRPNITHTHTHIYAFCRRKYSLG